MNKEKIRVILEEKGLDEELVDLPIVYDAIESITTMNKDTEDISQFIHVSTPTRFKIGGVSFDFRTDGTIKVERSGFNGYYIANKEGIEVEHIIERKLDGERKAVRRDGLIYEVRVTDQGEQILDDTVRVDNGNPLFHNAYGSTVIRQNGKLYYFNPDEVLLNFDRNSARLQYGTEGQKIYRRELRIQVEQAMQDEKISRLPLADQVEALRRIKDDLEREYKYLCDIIELDLEAHRNDLSFIEKISRFPKLKNDFSVKLKEYKDRVAKQRIKPDEYGEIYPRILPYNYKNDDKQPDEIKLQAERNSLEEKIYAYRKRNAELRARHDRSTEMLRAMVPVYNAVADEHYPKGFVLNVLLGRIIETYDRESRRIRERKEERCESERRTTASIKKHRKDEQDKKKFDARRKEERKATPEGGKKIEEKIVPKTEGKGLDDDE